MNFKAIKICGVFALALLISVVHCDGGQSKENAKLKTIEEPPIKKEVVIRIGEIPTEDEKLAINSVEDTFDISFEIDKYTNTTTKLMSEKSIDSLNYITLQPNVMVTQYYICEDWAYVCLDNDTYGWIKTEYLSNEETPVSELNRWKIDLSDDEIELLAKILFLEANTESYKGQVAVVETIFNRITNGYWGDSLYEVLSSSGQFTTWKNRDIAEPTLKNYQVIYDVLYGNTNVLSMDYLYFSRGGHMSHKGVLPIGNHQFCTKG